MKHLFIELLNNKILFGTIALSIGVLTVCFVDELTKNKND